MVQKVDLQQVNTEKDLINRKVILSNALYYKGQESHRCFVQIQ